MLRVLDAYALMAFLEDEPGASHVRRLLLEAVKGEIRLAITTVNLGEVYYSITRSDSLEVAERIVGELTALPLEIVDVGWELARQAARIKAQTPISYADCFAAGLARQMGCAVVTGDPEFHRLEDQVEIEWLERENGSGDRDTAE
jgi:predicted nucleic acid-binding protein